MQKIRQKYWVNPEKTVLQTGGRKELISLDLPAKLRSNKYSKLTTHSVKLTVFGDSGPHSDRIRRKSPYKS